jgi:hypothetical protein
MVAERDAKEEERQAAQKHSKSVIESLDAEAQLDLPFAENGGNDGAD